MVRMIFCCSLLIVDFVELGCVVERDALTHIVVGNQGRPP